MFLDILTSPRKKMLMLQIGLSLVLKLGSFGRKLVLRLPPIRKLRSQARSEARQHLERLAQEIRNNGGAYSCGANFTIGMLRVSQIL